MTVADKTEFVALSLSESVELAAAWMQRTADARKSRVLLIKGATLEFHALRGARVPADIDVLVDPSRYTLLAEALVYAGWSERPTFASQQFTLHSRTFFKDGWPCTIDLHESFPGFLSDPGDVFELLWQRRTSMTLAHQSVEIPDRVSCALVMALHAAREGASGGTRAAELEFLANESVLSHGEREDAAVLAQQTRCAAPLEAILPRLGISVTLSSEELASPDVREWKSLVTAMSTPAYPWLRAWKDADWRARRVLAVQAVWPSAEDLRRNHSHERFGALAILRIRLSRWNRGVRSLPRAIRARREDRHGSAVL